MRNKKLFFIAVLILGQYALHAQDGVIVNDTQGDSWSIFIDDIKKINFSNTDLTFIDQQNEQVKTFLFEDVKNIIFSEITSVQNNSIDMESLKIYPNPVGDYLFVKAKDIDKELSVNIYTTDGVLCSAINSWDGNPIDVSYLQSGHYILKINNHTSKFIKL